ncbi:MAG: preprotein translocase subunit YajC [Planctomycetes bacterium]|nr:preprotein translocase subunit YajC [Planctomycetota bacterium]
MTDFIAAAILQAPPLPGQPAPAPAAVEGSAPAGGAAPAAAPQDPGGFFWILIPMMLVILVLPMITGRKERKKREAMLASIANRDRVQTIGGIIGVVTEVKSDQVTLRVDESSGTKLTFARNAVSDILEKAKSAD